MILNMMSTESKYEDLRMNEPVQSSHKAALRRVLACRNGFGWCYRVSCRTWLRRRHGSKLYEMHGAGAEFLAVVAYQNPCRATYERPWTARRGEKIRFCKRGM